MKIILIKFIKQPINACKNNQCKRGSKCIPNDKNSGYTCKCKQGTKGRFCDQGEAGSIMNQSMMVEDEENLSNEKSTNGTAKLFISSLIY